MLFNSLEFIFFLLFAFICYWFVLSKWLKLQNILLLILSYFFYAWWDYRFLGLIVFSTTVDYFIGIALDRSSERSKRQWLLFLSVFINLGLLCFFKYYNFFVESLIESFSIVGLKLNLETLHIILPVGISFYTFQTLSYTIDVYNRKLKATTDFIAFAGFVSFFPQLVAGPIERAKKLLPQFQRTRTFTYENGIEGLTLISWGFFKKVVIADNLAPIVNQIFGNYESYSSSILVLGAVLFAFQIYGDFSGYSSIARGLAKLFGFELMVNFDYPYFSRNIGEFWRKWHISLSTWFRDYVYIPLGGSRVSRIISIRNVFIVFIISGFWHGANWTFIGWGLLHVLIFLPSFYSKNSKKYEGTRLGEHKLIPSLRELVSTLYTFSVVTFAWILFRSETINDAYQYIKRIFTSEQTQDAFINPYDNQPFFKEILILLIFIFLEYLLNAGKLDKYQKHRPTLIVVNIILIISLILNNPIGSELSFIYFQF